MKLKDYIKGLQELIKDNPASKEYEVVYACDDEGNAYCQVHFLPSIGEWNEESQSFHVTRTPEDYNAICLN